MPSLGAREPAIALVLGDPAGIGPELIAKLVARKDLMSRARVAVVGDRWLWQLGQSQAGLVLPLPEIGAWADLARRPAGACFFPVETVAPAEITPGASGPAGGKSALQVLRSCLAAAVRGDIDALCFAPLNKLSLKLAGMEFADELHFFAHGLRVKGFVGEFNILGKLWTARVTSHIPLRQVSVAITKERIKEATSRLHSALLRAGFSPPRIAVAALNPHAGEGGTCGREEIEIIGPAVEESRAEGLAVLGPYPADTLFVRAQAGEFDGIVTMYHDQGQIAMKLMGFRRGVTLQGGLPVVVTTPAHGTAFEIVGQNRADPGAMIEAYGLAVAMAENTAFSSSKPAISRSA